MKNEMSNDKPIRWKKIPTHDHNKERFDDHPTCSLPLHPSDSAEPARSQAWKRWERRLEKTFEMRKVKDQMKKGKCLKTIVNLNFPPLATGKHTVTPDSLLAMTWEQTFSTFQNFEHFTINIYNIETFQKSLGQDINDGEQGRTYTLNNFCF